MPIICAPVKWAERIYRGLLKEPVAQASRVIRDNCKWPGHSDADMIVQQSGLQCWIERIQDAGGDTRPAKKQAASITVLQDSKSIEVSFINERGAR